MRLDGAVPEAPRRLLGCRGEKIVEVGSIVVAADASRGGRGRASIERFACHPARFAFCIVGDSGSPALGRMADEPAVFRQGLAPALKLCGKVADVVGRLLELPGIPTGQQ